MASEAGVAIEALERVGVVGDENREAMTSRISCEFKALNQSGKKGWKYPWIPDDLVSLADVVKALDSGEYTEDKQYPDSFVDGRLWTPGEHPDGHSAESLAGFDKDKPGDGIPLHSRLAVVNFGSKSRLLHFLDQPFDEFRSDPDEETQLIAVAAAQERYEAAHEGFSMVPLDAKGVAMIALMHRIKGRPTPLEGYQMRDATLPRLRMQGVELVGDVRTAGDQFRLNSSFGFNRPVSGIGLSVGPKPEDL